MAGTRSFAAGRFALQLDGVSCGFLAAADGGDISADVISEPSGPAGFVKKHIGQPKYEDFELQAGFDLAKPFYDWIIAAWNLKPLRKSGAIVSTDVNQKPVSERQFENALLSEVTIPALDGSSKESGYLKVKFSPEHTRTAKAAGTVAKVPVGKQKAFVASNFRAAIDGLDCTKVSKVDAFTVKQAVSADSVGEVRIRSKEPTSLEFPNLKITLAEASAKTWDAWFEDFVVKGSSGDTNEKSGVLFFLAPDRKAELARVTLHNLGIVALRRQRQGAGASAIQRVTAELYCERMELHVGPAPAAAVARVR